MGSGIDAVIVRTPFEEFTVRLKRGGPPPEGQQIESVLRAARDFRFGIEMGEPGILRAARELIHLLDGGGFGFGGDLTLLDDAGEGFGRASGSVNGAFRDISLRIEEELLAGRLVVEREHLAPLTDRREPFELELPPLPPAPRES